MRNSLSNKITSYLKESEETKTKKTVNVDYDFLMELLYNYDAIRNYADDGMLDRNDPDYADFFEEIDKAEKLSIKLGEILEEVD